MKINLYKVKDFLYKYRVYITVLAVFVLLFFVIDSANAEWYNPLSWAKSAGKATLGALISVATLILYYVFLTPIFWLIAAMIWVLTEVASFQQFINVPAVIAGWTIMRDLVNMGFVLALIYISFLTIIGKRPNIGKDLVQLVLAIIAVNFSRMIVGLFIDFSQIIMLTFVNGFRNIAGGNIINKLNLNHYLSEVGISFNPENAGKLFVKVSLGITMGLFVLAILVMMTLYLIIRVVTLWILTIMSPMVALSLAPGADGVLKPFISEWNKQFRDALMGGPFMAFFLWFSLTVIGTTGTEGAITTPSGKMGESFKGDVDSSPLFTLIIGTALLYAGYKQSKTMAGAAGAAGGKVFGMAKSYAKGVGKLADTGARWGSKYAFKKDLSYTGVKKMVGKKLSDAKAGVEGIDLKLDNRAIRKATKKSKDKALASGKYEGLAKEHSSLDLVGQEYHLKTLQHDDKQLAAQSESGLDKIQGKKDSRVGALAKFSEANENLSSVEDNLQNLKSEQSSFDNFFSGAATDKEEKETLDALTEKGVISQWDASLLMKSNLTEDEKKEQDGLITKLEKYKANTIDTSVEDYTEKYSEAQNKQQMALDEVRSNDLSQEKMDALDAAYESGDQNMIQTALADMQDDFDLSDEEIAGIADQKSTVGEEREAKIKIDEKTFGIAEKKGKELEKEMKHVVQSAVLKTRAKAAHRVLLDDVSHRRTEMRKSFKSKRPDVNSTDEIAAYFKSGDLTSEETNDFLEQLGDKVGDALERAGYEPNSDGEKALLANSMGAAKTAAEVEAIAASKAGRPTKAQSEIVQVYLNKNAGQSDWDTQDIVSKNNKSKNASLSSMVTMDPHGVHQFKSREQQYQDVSKDYDNARINAKSMTSYLIEKDDNGDPHLTDFGYSFIVKHQHELRRDNFSDEFGKGLKSAIQNDQKLIKEYLIMVEKDPESKIKGTITGKTNIEGTSGYYNPKKPQSNPLAHILDAVEVISSGGVGSSSESKLLREHGRDIIEKNKKQTK